MGDLWHNYNGTITKPKQIDQVLFLPQRTYTAFGTLVEQLTYPFIFENLCEEDFEFLQQALTRVRLDYLIKRLPNGFSSKMNWTDLLSPGEKQRLAFARLFFLFQCKRIEVFNEPDFIVLDEATSALDVDVEQAIYNELLQLGVTVISVGHRPTLLKFHKTLLTLDNEGGYSIQQVQAS